MSLFDKLQAKGREKIDAEKAKGKAFLEENKKRPEVTETASGLQYEVLVPGSGEKPTASSKVTTHYTGSTLDGNVFDSSVRRGQPLSFGLNQVIRGWTEGLQLMPVGSKYKFYIPSDLAYGDGGAGGSIPGGATLVFEVELLSFV
jgi:FKBP-type peptidyl-prolyl cis-trans isomerase